MVLFPSELRVYSYLIMRMSLFDNEFFKTHYIYVFDSLSSLNNNEFFKPENELFEHDNEF